MIQFDITKDKLDYNFSSNANETINFKDLFSEIRDDKTLTISFKGQYLFEE